MPTRPTVDTFTRQQLYCPDTAIEFHAFVKNAAGSSSHDVTDTASSESLRLQLVELGLGDRSRVEKLLGRRDLIGARAATARGDN